MTEERVLFCFLFICIVCATSSTTSEPLSKSSFSFLHEKCIDDERKALLQLKQDLSTTTESSSSFRPSSGNSTLPSWGLSTDCCSWEGVTCHKITGHVVSLDLSGKQLSGLVNTTNFLHLPYLKRLNLANNDFQASPFPSRLDLIANLTHLNLSNSGFSGQIPPEILRLGKLVSLDLSTDDLDFLKLENPDFQMLVKSLNSLRQLLLDGVNMSASGAKWCNALPSAVPDLEVLSLSYCQLSGSICESIDQLSQLSKLDLGGNNFSSVFPKSIMQLPKLRSLDLRLNDLLSGTLPEFPTQSKLEVLSLSFTRFSGELPDSIGNLKFLTQLLLQRCDFSGVIPSSLATLTHLELMDLSSNNFQGWIPLLHPVKIGTGNGTPIHVWSLRNLRVLHINNNSMEARINALLFTLPSLNRLGLGQNRLSGELKAFNQAPQSQLTEIDLSSNSLEGPIPDSLFQLPNLTQLQLFSNNFSGAVNLGKFKSLRNLVLLDLSNNSKLSISHSWNWPLPRLRKLLMRSCNVSEFPGFLRNQDGLDELDLADNNIPGKIPMWVFKASLFYLNLSSNFLTGLEAPVPTPLLSSLSVLDLSFNLIEGPLPILPPAISLLSFAGNKLTGDIPISICNMSSLSTLDVCLNNMRGRIPQCLGDISATLTVLNLRGNSFRGSMDWNFTEECSLKTLNLYGNRIKGKIPYSLRNCQGLEVLDLGGNQINGTFPSWLGSLPQLQVLVLQSNRLHGPIGRPPTQNDLPMLHILDLSSNHFTGDLPSEYIRTWKSMMKHVNESELYMGGYSYREWMTVRGYHYRDCTTITSKGLKMDDIHILTISTVLDLSNNLFEGGIPEVIGDLKLLQVLNLSRNNLVGDIPSSLSNLKQLESLDLSQNKLTGQIPKQLTSLTFLSVLNLSHNALVGGIPEGNQFSTFNNDSYQGNPGLCGLPLSRKCGDVQDQPPGTNEETSDSDNGIAFDWKFALLGYGSAVPLGAVIGHLFSRTRKCTLWIQKLVGTKKPHRNARNRRRRSV